MAYMIAAVVILLALAVGLFRLLLPRLPEYQEEIKVWADAAIGMQVEFADMDARWRLSGPELTFIGAKLSAHGADASLLSAGEVSVGVSLLRLLRDRELIADRIMIRNSRLKLQLSEKNGWLIQGVSLAEIARSGNLSTGRSGNVVIVAENIAIDYRIPTSGKELSFVVDRIKSRRMIRAWRLMRM